MFHLDFIDNFRDIHDARCRRGYTYFPRKSGEGFKNAIDPREGFLFNWICR